MLVESPFSSPPAPFCFKKKYYALYSKDIDGLNSTNIFPIHRFHIKPFFEIPVFNIIKATLFVTRISTEDEQGTKQFDAEVNKNRS